MNEIDYFRIVALLLDTPNYYTKILLNTRCSTLIERIEQLRKEEDSCTVQSSSSFCMAINHLINWRRVSIKLIFSEIIAQCLFPVMTMRVYVVGQNEISLSLNPNYSRIMNN